MDRVSSPLPNRLQIFSYNRQRCNKFSLGVLSLGGPAAQIPPFVFSTVDEFTAIGKKRGERSLKLRGKANAKTVTVTITAKLR